MPEPRSCWRLRPGMSNVSKRLAGKAARRRRITPAAAVPARAASQKRRAPASPRWRAAAMPLQRITCTNSLSRPEGFSLSRETLRGILRAARSGTIGLKAGPRLTALGLRDDAAEKILAVQLFGAKAAEGSFHLLQSLRCCGVPWASTVIAAAASNAMTITPRLNNNSPSAASPRPRGRRTIRRPPRAHARAQSKLGMHVLAA